MCHKYQEIPSSYGHEFLILLQRALFSINETDLIDTSSNYLYHLMADFKSPMLKGFENSNVLVLKISTITFECEVT